MYRQKQRARSRLHLDYKLHVVFAWAIFALSGVPFLLTITAPTPGAEGVFADFLNRVPYFPSVKKWYVESVEPVQELRPLAAAPITWEGRWFDVDKNYAHFEKWFSDHLGLRDLMIRSKNELDYQIFRSSPRVYFGEDYDIYGRGIIDTELPATEAILDTPEKIEAIHHGMVRYSERMKANGVTTIFVTPMQKPTFYPGRLPFFAPRMPDATNFMSLYRTLKDDPALHFVDVFGILQSLRTEFPIFYTQDFHWTNMAALAVARDTVDRISKLEGSENIWTHPIQIEYLPFEGSDARFSARLNAKDKVMEPQLVKSWEGGRIAKPLDAKLTGLEFETDELSDTKLLPPTCMYGNSFSDGMIEAGILDYFQKFTKIDRMRPLSDVPGLINGHCKYLIVQILDIQTGHWLSLK
jgi:alginate O-acetyltransferase complex protein AlgJ